MTYFDYFSEIEERFVTRRGSVLLLSTLDWALIETWREAGVPLAAVLRGIDTAFDRYEARKGRAKGRLARVNGLAWCAQAVMQAATELAEATVGSLPPSGPTSAPMRDTGFESGRIVAFLERNAAALEHAAAHTERIAATPEVARGLAVTVVRLRELAAEVRVGSHAALDTLDRTLTVLEERLVAMLVGAAPEAELIALREDADRELAPVRARLGAVQGRQVREQFVHKRLLAVRGIPRLSLFYLPIEGTEGVS